MKPKVMILHAPGTNRDGDAAHACELAGGQPEIVHINQLRAGTHQLDDYAMLLLPGGFSYGDALGAGARLALDLRVYFQDALAEYIEAGRMVLGICNGFQALVKAGLLPGTDPDGERTATLTENASGQFECRWVHLAVNRTSPATYLHAIDDLIYCPVAHGEGNFQAKPATVDQLTAQELVVFRYVDAQGRPANGSYPLNPNVSVADIAGICIPQGKVVGLMPHPENHSLAIQNPLGTQGRLGLPLFSAMIGAAIHA